MARILVVDDEPDIRMLLRLTLGLDGHDVMEAASGVEALDVIDQQRPDAVLLDVMMPVLSGWDTLRTLKTHADAGVRETPVLMLTALTGPMDRVTGGIEGAVRYLSKPVDSDELRESLAEALAGEPEPVQRRRAQTQALENLARIEAGDAGPSASPSAAPRPRFAGLEAARPQRTAVEAPPLPPTELVAELTDKQREILLAIAGTPTVLAAAGELGTSRSNVYASLRRIARRLAIHNVVDLIHLTRAGHLP